MGNQPVQLYALADLDHALTLLGVPDDPPLAVVRYTQRQRGAFENNRSWVGECGR